MLHRHPTSCLPLFSVLLACTGDESVAAAPDTATSGPTTDPNTPTTAVMPEPGSSTGSSTGEAEGSSTSSETTGDPAPSCGDGIIDPGEQCDEGDAKNTEDGSCLPNCLLATCGDGFVHAGAEQCDSGEFNSHDFGGCNPITCHWGPNCGDGVVTPGHELCDPGAPVDPRTEVVPCTPTCRFSARVVFLSSESYNGNMGGTSGADLKCQTLARAFDPERHHTYRAWISDVYSAPASAFDHGPEFVDVPYVLLNGVQVADDFDDLIQDGPAVGITITDTYQSVIDARVWTHVDSAGKTIPDGQHCELWMSSSPLSSGGYGWNAVADDSPDLLTWHGERWWTRRGTAFCGSSFRLYCFEN